jgi:hypothetical protein
MPWLLIAGILGLAAGIVFLVSAIHPRPERTARLAAQTAERDAKLSAAEAYYSERDHQADRDWRGGDVAAPVVAAPPVEPVLVAPQAPPVVAAPVVATPFPAVATLSPIPKAAEPPPVPVPVPVAVPVVPVVPEQPVVAAGAFPEIRSALAAGKLDDAEKMLNAARESADGLALAELTGLAGDHAAAAGRLSNAKWLWRLAVKRFGELDAMSTPAAKAVSESLRTAG